MTRRLNIPKAVEYLRTMPLALFVVLPPLILRFRFLPVPAELGDYFTGPYVVDVMSWWKSVFIVGLGLWLLVCLAALSIIRRRLPFEKLAGLITLAGAAVVASALASEYPVTAWLGYPGLDEGALALLAYLTAIYAAARIPRLKIERLLLLRLAGFVGLINAIVGIGQGLGRDLWRTGFGRRIIGMDGGAITDNFSASRMAFGIMYQPNHYGMFMAMIAMLALGMFFAERIRWWRAYWMAVLLLGSAGVVFSQSRAALLVCLVLGVPWVVAKLVTRDRFGRIVRFLGRKVRGVPLYAVFAAIAAAALWKTAPSVMPILTAQARRTLADFSRSERPEGLLSASLIDDEISLVTASETVRLRVDESGAWRARDGGGGHLAVRREKAGPQQDRLVIPDIPEFSMSESAGGGVRVAVNDIALDFHRHGSRLCVVDFEGNLFDRMDVPRVFDVHGFERMFSGRLYLWSRTIPLLADRPILGYGPGTFPVVFPNLDLVGKQRFYYRVNEDKPHALWLGLPLHCGFLGGGLTLLIMFSALYAAVRSGTALGYALGLGMAAYLLGGFTNDSTAGVTPIFCILCGLAFCGELEDGHIVPYRHVKRLMDVILVTCSLPILVPICLAVAVMIKLEDRGRVLFVQERLGRSRRPFRMYKFRTMREDSPRDIPTHLLHYPETHITRVGIFLRRYSLDELPQLFNVLKGELSLVGPRPVLANEVRLLRERDKYGANDITPGITGLAQINGRDILTPSVKAKFDGRYVREMDLWLDVHILLATLPIAINGRGMAEGLQNLHKPR